MYISTKGLTVQSAKRSLKPREASSYLPRIVLTRQIRCFHMLEDCASHFQRFTLHVYTPVQEKETVQVAVPNPLDAHILVRPIAVRGEVPPAWGFVQRLVRTFDKRIPFLGDFVRGAEYLMGFWNMAWPRCTALRVHALALGYECNCTALHALPTEVELRPFLKAHNFSRLLRPELALRLRRRRGDHVVRARLAHSLARGENTPREHFRVHGGQRVVLAVQRMTGTLLREGRVPENRGIRSVHKVPVRVELYGKVLGPLLAEVVANDSVVTTQLDKL